MNLLEKADQLEERAAAMRAYIAGDPVEMLVTEPGEPSHPEWVHIIPQWAENKRYRVVQNPLAKGHNPDRLTVSQVGEGWRLLDGDEVKFRRDSKEIQAWGKDAKYWLSVCAFNGSVEANTYRTRLSRYELAALDKPAWKLPEPPKGKQWHRTDWTEEMLPEGYRPLLMGELTQTGDEVRDAFGAFHVMSKDGLHMHGSVHIARVRTKRPLPAWKLSRHIEGFRPLEDGEEWHRSDFTEDMLPSGWRPLLLNEKPIDGDEFYSCRDWKIQDSAKHVDFRVSDGAYHHRTRRPLPVKDVPWNCADDVPGPICWLKRKRDGLEIMVTEIYSTYIRTGGSASIGISWDELSYYEHSTDRKTWKPCVKPAK